MIAFGARMMGKDKNQPKYINSPETEIYHKSNVLYGLYQAKNIIRQKDNCFLVEGYTDVLSMHQSDVENVVASSGTALTEEQIKLIKRFTENVTVLFDGDAAGIKAALRGIDLILKGGLNVRVVLLPDNNDPDSYSRKVGTSEFQKYLAQKSQDFISFKAGLFAAESGNDPIRKAESIKEIVGSIALIPDPIKRSVYLQETSQQLKIGEPVLLTELNKLLIDERNKRDKVKNQPPRQPVSDGNSEVAAQIIDAATIGPTDDKDSVFYQERETARLLIRYGSSSLGEHSVAEYLVSELDDVEFSNDIFKEIFNYYHEGLQKGEILDSQYLITHGSKEMRNVVAELIMSKEEISPNWRKKHIYISEESELLTEMTNANVNRLKFWMVKKMMSENLNKIRELGANGDDKEVDTYLEQRDNLKKAERELAALLGIVVAR